MAQSGAIRFDNDGAKIRISVFVTAQIPATFKPGNSKPCRMSDTGNRHPALPGRQAQALGHKWWFELKPPEQ